MNDEIATKTARVSAYQSFFDSEDGRAVLLDLIYYHYMPIAIDIQKPDALVMAFREGERNVVNRVLSILNADQQTVLNLITEANDYARTGTRSRRK